MYGKNIDSFDWDDLYKKANDFILENIPVANVNTGSKTLDDQGLKYLSLAKVIQNILKC